MTIEWVMNRPEVEGWVAQRIETMGLGSDFGPSLSVGMVKGGQIIAGVIFHDWKQMPRTFQVSIASDDPSWVSRRNFASILSYPFEWIEIPANKVWAAIPHQNERVIRFCKAIGFKAEATLRHQFAPGKHAVILGMMRNEFRKRYLHES